MTREYGLLGLCCYSNIITPHYYSSLFKYSSLINFLSKKCYHLKLSLVECIVAVCLHEDMHGIIELLIHYRLRPLKHDWSCCHNVLKNWWSGNQQHSEQATLWFKIHEIYTLWNFSKGLSSWHDQAHNFHKSFSLDTTHNAGRWEISQELIMRWVSRYLFI